MQYRNYACGRGIHIPTNNLDRKHVIKRRQFRINRPINPKHHRLLIKFASDSGRKPTDFNIRDIFISINKRLDCVARRHRLRGAPARKLEHGYGRPVRYGYLHRGGRVVVGAVNVQSERILSVGKAGIHRARYRQRLRGRVLLYREIPLRHTAGLRRQDVRVAEYNRLDGVARGYCLNRIFRHRDSRRDRLVRHRYLARHSRVGVNARHRDPVRVGTVLKGLVNSSRYREGRVVAVKGARQTGRDIGNAHTRHVRDAVDYRLDCVTRRHRLHGAPARKLEHGYGRPVRYGYLHRGGRVVVGAVNVQSERILSVGKAGIHRARYRQRLRGRVLLYREIPLRHTAGLRRQDVRVAEYNRLDGVARGYCLNRIFRHRDSRRDRLVRHRYLARHSRVGVNARHRDPVRVGTVLKGLVNSSRYREGRVVAVKGARQTGRDIGNAHTRHVRDAVDYRLNCVTRRHRLRQTSTSMHNRNNRCARTTCNRTARSRFRQSLATNIVYF